MLKSDFRVPSSAENKVFKEYLKNGDDFSKIEIYRLARNWYQKAFDTGIHPELIKERMEDLDQKIRFERKIVNILTIITAVLIAGFFIISGL